MALHDYPTQIEHVLAPVRHVLTPILSDPPVMGVWAVVVLGSAGTLWWDIRERNQALRSLMNGVWTLVVLYSGPFGLAVCWYSGRTQIDTDSPGGEAFGRQRTVIRAVAPVKSSLHSETPSITVIETAVIGTDLLIASQAHISDPVLGRARVFAVRRVRPRVPRQRRPGPSRRQGGEEKPRRDG